MPEWAAYAVEKPPYMDAFSAATRLVVLTAPAPRTPRGVDHEEAQFPEPAQQRNHQFEVVFSSLSTWGRTSFRRNCSVVSPSATCSSVKSSGVKTADGVCPGTGMRRRAGSSPRSSSAHLVTRASLRSRGAPAFILLLNVNVKYDANGPGGPFLPARRNSRLTFPQRLVQVRDDVVFVLQTTERRTKSSVTPVRAALRRQLLVGGGRRVDHEALGVRRCSPGGRTA